MSHHWTNIGMFGREYIRNGKVIARLPLTLNIPEVAGILAISKTSAYAAARRGDLPGVIRLGKRIVAGRAALEGAFREGWVPPQRKEV